MENLSFRDAVLADLPIIVAMLADDEIGAAREKPAKDLAEDYVRAFHAMQKQAGNRQIVAEADGKIVGCFQMTLIPGLSRTGMTRAEIEALRVTRDMRGRGVGALLMEYAVDEARKARCGLIQLTTDKRRERAHVFYERLGFKRTHEGYKLDL